MNHGYSFASCDYYDAEDIGVLCESNALEK